MGIEKRYGGVRALKHVSFDLEAGEVHALIGENGAGKSTLIKVLTGAVNPDGGSVELNGVCIERNSPSVSRALGIVAIYQQPQIFPDLSVSENIALFNEAGGMANRIRWADRCGNAKRLLAEIGSDIDPAREAGTLSMPEQQIVEIAKALSANLKVLILDEPTASLTDREADRLFDVIRRLRARGAGLVYISHRLEELSAISDRVTVLRDGETIETRNASDTDARTLIRLMAGRDLSAVFPKRIVPIGAPVLELKALASDEAGVSDVTLTVRAGEILGIAGLVGAGRTQLAETLFGLTPADHGSIAVNGVIASVQSPSDAIEAGIAYVPEDRRSHGVVIDLPVRANATMAILDRISNLGLLRLDREREIATDWVARLGVKTDGIDAPVGSLSGGNQQKVAIARWLATNPKVLILDEPTQGIDVGAKSECHRIMCDLAEKGLAIVMISSELPEILGMSDRVAVMRGGRIQGVLDRADAGGESILALALGHGASGQSR